MDANRFHRGVRRNSDSDSRYRRTGVFGDLAVPLDELRYQRAVGIDDNVARQLLSSVLPAIAQPEHAHPLFLDHVVMAMASHIAYAYGGVRARQMHHRGGLAAWQLRRATQLMSESLTEGPGLRRLVRRSESLYARIQSRGWRESGPVAPRLVSRRSTEAATRLALRVNPGDGIGRLGLAEQAGRRRTRHQRVTGERRTEVRSFTG